MKKKVFLALLVLIFCFTGGGIYIARSIEGVIANLENVITLHQVEFLRKELQNKIKTVQTDLLLKDSPHALHIDPFISHVEEMERAARICSKCHHREEVRNGLDHLQGQVERYLKKLSRVYTLRANKERIEQEREAAFSLGEQTLAEIETIVIPSAEKMSGKIAQASGSITETLHFLFFLLIAGPLVLLGITYFLLHRFTSSVDVLLDATRRIRQGDLRYRVTEKLPDEFQVLAAAFNDMANSLKDQCLHMQHAERLAVVGELAAGLAHEVKNPLAGIKVSIEVLANDLPLEQEDREIFLRIINEIHRIEALLKSLLSYARPPEPEPVPVNLRQLLEATIKTAQYSLINPANTSQPIKKIEFSKEFGQDIPAVVADPGQLQQIFLNLMLNAVDAIQQEGTITVRTRREANGAVQIAVADSGRGMSSDTLAKIFNPFFTTKPKGTGLGLAICKRLIELHRGTIHAASTSGAGTTFYITLPAQPASEGDRP
jgi:signal transduction histidine kinase